MKKMIILRNIQATMKTFVPPFFNHFSLSLSGKKCVVMRVMRKNLQKTPADILRNSQENICVLNISCRKTSLLNKVAGLPFFNKRLLLKLNLFMLQLPIYYVLN